jgi:MoaA/NifB/PqqE/SkfB family radical SAM enzyme
MPAFSIILPRADEGNRLEQLLAAFAPDHAGTVEIVGLVNREAEGMVEGLNASVPVKTVLVTGLDQAAALVKAADLSAGDWLILHNSSANFDFNQVKDQARSLETRGALAGPCGNAGPVQLPLGAGGFRNTEELLQFCAAHKLVPMAPLMVRRSFFQGLWPAQSPASTAARDPRGDLGRLRAGAGSGCVLSGPETIQIGPTDACNSRCLFCRIHSPLFQRPREASAGGNRRTTLDYDAWMRCLDDLAAMNVRGVDYIGIGEPLAHPRIDDALRATHGRFQRVGLYSNGILLKAHAQAVSQTVDNLTISLNAGTSTTYSKMHVCPSGTFERVIEGIAAVKKLGGCRQGIQLSFVVNKLNFREIPALADLCRQLDVKVGLTSLGVYPETEATLGFTPAERDELFGLLQAMEQRPDHRVTNLEQYRQFYDRDVTCIVERIPCYVGFIFAQIRGNGGVAFCCAGNATLGNIHDRSFRDIWFSAAYDRLRRRALTQIVQTGQSLPGCHCSICGFALESLRVFNQIHGTALTFEQLKRSIAYYGRLQTAAEPVPA